MSKKRGKSASKKQASAVLDGAHSELLNEDSWFTYPVLVHAIKPYAVKYSKEALEEARGGRRRKFKVLTKEEADLVCADAVKAKGKSKDPVMAVLFEACMSGVEDGMLTTQGYAAFVHAKLKQAKQDELQRRADEEEARLQAEQERLGLSSAQSGRKTPKSASKKGKSAKGKKGKGGGDDESLPGKKKVTMKTRSEESAHIDFIDDEPLSGADQYWLLQGFSTDPKFISSLQSNGVSLSAVVNVVTKDDDDEEEDTEDNHNIMEGEENEEESQANEDPAAQAELEATQLREAFIDDARALVLQAENTSSLKDIAWLTLDIGCAPLAFDSFKNIADLIYKNLEDANIHSVYVNSLNPSHIPTTSPSTTLDTSLYTGKLAQIHPENVTVHVLLDCLLSQVVSIVDSEDAVESEIDGDDEDSAVAATELDPLDAFLDSQLEGIFVPQDDSSKDIESDEDSAADVSFQDTVVVGFYDNISYKFGTERRQPYDGRRGALSILQHSSFANKIFSSFPEEAPYTDDQRQARLQQVEKFSSLSSPRRNQCLKMINMENMLATATSTGVDTWDLSDWCVTEQLNHTSLLQSIEVDLQKDGSEICTWYNDANHTLLLAVYSNIVDEVRTTKWSHVVDTQVGFSNFLEHTLPYLKGQNDRVIEDAEVYLKKRNMDLAAEEQKKQEPRPVSAIPAQVLEEDASSSRRGSAKAGRKSSAKSHRSSASKRGVPKQLDGPEENAEVATELAPSEKEKERENQRKATTPRGGYDLTGTLVKVVGESQYMHPYDGAVVSLHTYDVVQHGSVRRWKLSRDLATLSLFEHTETTPMGDTMPAGFSFSASFKDLNVELSHRVIEALRTKGKSEHDREQAAYVANVLASEGGSLSPADDDHTKDAGGKGSGKKGGKDKEKEKDSRPKSKRVHMKKSGEEEQQDEMDAEERERMVRMSTPKFKPKPQQSLFQLAVCDSSSISIIFHPEGYVEMSCGDLRKEKVAYRLVQEKKRFIFASGVVVRTLTNGTSVVYNPDGSVFTVKDKENWTQTTFDGVRIVKHGTSKTISADNEENSGNDEHSQLHQEEDGNTDGSIEIGKVALLKRDAVAEHVSVICREDNVMLIAPSPSQQTVEYADGTRVYERKASSSQSDFRIECLGLPAVSIKNGSIFTVSFSHGDVVYDNSSGSFSYDAFNESCSLSLTANGKGCLSFDGGRQQVHDFDYFAGSYSCIDAQGSSFAITDMVPSVSLSDKAMLSPLSQRCSPALYVIEDDGSGEKLLRHEDVAGYVEMYQRAMTSGDKSWKKVTNPLESEGLLDTYIETTKFPNTFFKSYHESTPLPYSLQQLVSPHLEWEHNISLLLLRQLEVHEALTDQERQLLQHDKDAYDNWVQSMAKETINYDISDTRSDTEIKRASKLRQSMAEVLRHLDDSDTLNACKEMVRPEEKPHAQPSKERSRQRRQSKIMVEGWRQQLRHDNSVPNFYECAETQELVKELEEEVFRRSSVIVSSRGNSAPLSRASTLQAIGEDDEMEGAHDFSESEEGGVALNDSLNGETSTDSGDVLDHTSKVEQAPTRRSGKERPQYIMSTLSPEDLQTLNGGGHGVENIRANDYVNNSDDDDNDDDDEGDADSIDGSSTRHNDAAEYSSSPMLHNQVRDESARGVRSPLVVHHDEGDDDMEVQSSRLVHDDKTAFADNFSAQPLSPSQNSKFTFPSQVKLTHVDVHSPGFSQQDVEMSDSPQPLNPSSPTFGQHAPVEFGIPTSAKGNKRVLPDVRLKSATTLESEAAYPHDILERHTIITENVPQTLEKTTPLPEIGAHKQVSSISQQIDQHGASQAAAITVQPEVVDFGTLKASCVYSLIIRIKNTGSNLCSIDVHAPSIPGLSVSCIATQISPNMTVRATVQIDGARFLGNANDRNINSSMVVKADDKVVEIPIHGEVLSVAEFDSRNLSNRHRGKGVRLVATKPRAQNQDFN